MSTRQYSTVDHVLIATVDHDYETGIETVHWKITPIGLLELVMKWGMLSPIIVEGPIQSLQDLCGNLGDQGIVHDYSGIGEEE